MKAISCPALPSSVSRQETLHLPEARGRRRGLESGAARGKGPEVSRRCLHVQGQGDLVPEGAKASK